jgi:hypothetical protein
MKELNRGQAASIGSKKHYELMTACFNSLLLGLFSRYHYQNGRSRSVTGYKNLLVTASLIVLAGCGRLPDVNKIQGNMDQMVYYMGHMVNATTRMANTAERMESKSDGMVNDLGKRGATVERAVQNYSQAILDNERAMIKALQGIRQELNELKQGARSTGSKTDAQEQLRSNPVLQARLNELEDKLSTIVSNMEKHKKAP